MIDPAADRQTVTIERRIAAAPEKIWRALTQPELLAEWLMKNNFQPVVGQRFTLQRIAGDVTVAIDCEVLEVDMNRTLSYSWEAFGVQTVITFSLTPADGGTVLRMEHTGFRPEQRSAFKGARAGWLEFFDQLDELVAHIQ